VPAGSRGPVGGSCGALRIALVRSPGKLRPVSSPARSDAPLRSHRPAPAPGNQRLYGTAGSVESHR